MKLKKLLNIIKETHVANIMNVSGGVLFSNGENIYLAKDMPSIYSAEEFGAIFEIDEDKLPTFTVNIDGAFRMVEEFKGIKRGISLEKGGSFSFGGLRCVLFKKADARQLSINEINSGTEADFSGYIAIDPDMFSPISDGIISYEYISFFGKGAICAIENGSPVAVVKPLEVTQENIEFLDLVREGLSEYYK